MPPHYIALLLWLCIVHCTNAFHMHPLVNVHRSSTVRRATQSPQTLSMCCGVTVAGKDDFRRNAVAYDQLSYLKLDSGMRISRILTASTDSFDVMQKLSRAKTRSDIMQIALIRHKRKCILLEYQQIPATFDAVYSGWSYEHRSGSNIRTNSGTRSSMLWAIDEESFRPFAVEVGSWLLASIQGKDANHLSALFSRTISRVNTDAQPVSLVRPGFACIRLIHTESGPQWIVTFIEIEYCDELGVPNKRR